MTVMVQQVKNVNWAFDALKGLLLQKDMWRDISPRGQLTLEYKGVVITEYENPTERVLFNSQRDANPFFHFFESLWILDGRNDVKFLDQFNSNMKQFSDDGEMFHGAYGWRLRYEFGMDQIINAIAMFQADRSTRRVVLNIWHAPCDLNTMSKDIPCNDLLMFKIREGKLNMTLCCRSNDAVWGAYGANAVQFSVIQEFMAAAIGVEVGTFVQISDSFHIYTDREDFKKCFLTPPVSGEEMDPYVYAHINPYAIAPLGVYAQEWLSQLNLFLRHQLDGYREGDIDMFFIEVATPMWQAWELYKNPLDPDKNSRIRSAAHVLKTKCMAEDWSLAGVQWLERRMVEEKNNE